MEAGDTVGLQSSEIFEYYHGPVTLDGYYLLIEFDRNDRVAEVSFGSH